jgi:WD40 repeat protein
VVSGEWSKNPTADHSPLTTHHSPLTPKITDFGLAKKLDASSGPTASGAIMGTPSYMAPEQAGGHSKAIDTRADVYALGAILYELLTGRPPFKAATAMDTLFQVLSEEPVPVRQLQPKVDLDLETICLKCLQKEPSQRYGSAAALADDLGRFLAGEPIVARPVGRLERLAKWAKRRPALAGLVAVSVVAVLALGSFAAYFTGTLAESNRRLGQEVKRAEGAEADARQRAAEADAQRDRAERLAYARQLSLAQREWQDGNVTVAQVLLNTSQPNLRGWEYRYLDTLFNHRGQRTIGGHAGGWVFSVSFSPDGRHLASAGEDRTVWVMDVATCQAVRALQGHTRPVACVCFSADGKRLASASWDQTVKVWDATTGQEVRTLQGHTGNVSSVCFSPDGKRLASASSDQTVKVWDAATGQEVRTLQVGQSLFPASVCFSGDGQRLAAGSGAIDQQGKPLPGEVKIWDAATGQEVRTLKGHTGPVESVCFSPDSQRLASASQDQTVKVWEAATGQEVLTLKGHKADVSSVCFSADGKRLATAGGGLDQRNNPLPGEVKIWDAVNGQEILSLKGHSDRVMSVCFSPDGKCLASASQDRTVKVWDAQKGQEVPVLTGHRDPVHSVCFSPDGQRLASASGNPAEPGQPGEVKVWNVATFQEILALKGHSALVTGVCFSPDGKRLATASLDKTVKVWDAATGHELLTLKGHTDPVTSVCFSPDGQRLAAGSGTWGPREKPMPGKVAAVKVWDAQTGQEILSLKGGAVGVNTVGVRSVCFSPDGTRLATACTDGTVKVWDVATGQQVLTLQGHTAAVSSVCFSADGQRLASAGWDTMVKVWDAQTGQELLSLEGHTKEVFSVCFSPDGRRLATGSWDTTVKVWDAATGQEVLSLKEHTGMVTSVCFSPDGQRLASAGYDKTVKVWDAATGQEEPAVGGR